MAKDDYFVVVYRILAYLYACVKAGVKPDRKEISPAALEIEPGYWLYIMRYMQSDGYIHGFYSGGLLGATPAVKVDDVEITPKGITFHQENSSMAKAKEFLKTVKEIIPGL